MHRIIALSHFHPHYVNYVVIRLWTGFVGLGHGGNLCPSRLLHVLYTREYRSFRSNSLSNVLFIWLYVWARGFGLCFIPLLPLELGPDMCGLETPGAWWWGSKLINFRWIHKRACSQREKPLSHCLFIWAAVWPKSGPTGFGAHVWTVTQAWTGHHLYSNKVISKWLLNMISYS